MTDVGVDDKFMKELGEKLQPGGAAVFVLARAEPPSCRVSSARSLSELWMTSPPYCEMRGSTFRGRLAHEDEDRGAAGLQLLAKFLHELVVDADVRHRAGGGAARPADGHAQQRHEEDEADEAAPQRAAGRAAPARA